MKNRTRKLVSMLLTFTMLMSMLGMSAYAEDAISVIAADTTLPEIKVTVGDGVTKDPEGSENYCAPNGLTVTVSAPEGLTSVSYTDSDNQTTQVTLGTDKTSVQIKLEKEGQYTVTAVSGNGTTNYTVGVFPHFLGGRREEKTPATCELEGKTEAVSWCSYCGRDFYRTQISTVEPLGHDYKSITPCGDEDSEWKICTRCGETENGVPLPDGEHTWKVVKVESECSVDDYSYSMCEVCDALKDVKKTPSPGHSVNKWEITEAATCVIPGKQSGICIRCGATVTKSYRANGGHAPIYKTVKESTCTDAGKQEVYCQNEGCEYEYKGGSGIPYATYPIAKKSHTYVLTTTKEASCTEDGLKEYICSVCDEKQIGTGQIIKAYGHTPGEGAHDCTTPTICSVCNNIIAEPQAGHNWKVISDGSVYGDGHHKECQNPGCNEKTEIELHVKPENADPSCTVSFRCAVCGVSVKGAAQHNMSEKPQSVNNLWHQYTCQNPGCGVEEQWIHRWIKDPGDCTATAECKECGFIRSAYVRHNWGKAIHVGDQHERYCQNGSCTAKEVADHDFSGTDPNLVAWVVIQEATCTGEGSRYKVVFCAADGCAATKESAPETVSAKGHNYGDLKHVDTESCGSYDQEICESCGDVRITNYEESQHSWSVERIIDQEPTCIAGGSKSYHCTKCGASGHDSQPVPAVPHNYGSWIVLTPASCTEGAIEQGTCTFCHGATTIRLNGEPLGHSYENGVCTVCGAADPNYSGSISTGVQSGLGAPAGSLSTDLKELAAAVLTADEMELAREGVKIDIVLTVENADAAVGQAEISAVVSKAGEYTVGQYLAIDLYKVIDGNENNVTEISNPIRITLAIPESMRESDRKFAVIRVHDGDAELLEDQDDDPNTITIETDRFSTYALVYRKTGQEQETGSSTTPPSGGQNDKVSSTTSPSGEQSDAGSSTMTTGGGQSEKISSPKTGDEIRVEVWMTWVLLGTSLVMTIYRKREISFTKENHTK